MRGRERGLWVGLSVAVIKPLLLLVTKRDWSGQEHIPATGGVVVCVNHISHADPLATAHFVWDSGRTPRFLAKSGLFDLPVAGRVLKGARQIPVFRESRDAAKAFSAAVAAVRAGECVVVYPEGTLTRDPGLWPMAGKSGAVRLALTTGAPVVPVAQWGSQDLLPPYAKRPRLLPRATLRYRAGPPVDLSDLRGRVSSAAAMREANERIMDAITALLAELRPGEQPPVQRYDPRAAGDPGTGDPRRRAAEGRQ